MDWLAMRTNCRQPGTSNELTSKIAQEKIRILVYFDKCVNNQVSGDAGVIENYFIIYTYVIVQISNAEDTISVFSISY